jgi:hypothetical protein
MCHGNPAREEEGSRRRTRSCEAECLSRTFALRMPEKNKWLCKCASHTEPSPQSAKATKV